MASSIFCATSAASCAWRNSDNKMTNSSPPMRDTVSTSRTQAHSRRAASSSTASPKRWPNLSLMVLKRSRSTIINATMFWLRLAWISACRRRSSSRRRLGNSVSGSWLARNSARAWLRRNSVMSVRTDTIPPSAVRRSRACIHRPSTNSCTKSPSGWRWRRTRSTTQASTLPPYSGGIGSPREMALRTNCSKDMPFASPRLTPSPTPSR